MGISYIKIKQFIYTLYKSDAKNYLKVMQKSNYGGE